MANISDTMKAISALAEKAGCTFNLDRAVVTFEYANAAGEMQAQTVALIHLLDAADESALAKELSDGALAHFQHLESMDAPAVRRENTELKQKLAVAEARLQAQADESVVA
jgi:hypothetical protein